MSENLDLVRSIYADWARGDVRSVEWADPEFEFVIADGPDPGSGRGLDGMAKAALGWVGAFDGYRAAAEHLREAHPGCVLALVRGSGRPRGGTQQAEDHGAGVFEIRAGKVTRLALYTDCNRALADLGLKE